MGDTQTSEWIEHDGKGMPVDGETFVTAKREDGVVVTCPADLFGCSWSGRAELKGRNIVAYQLVKP